MSGPLRWIDATGEVFTSPVEPGWTFHESHPLVRIYPVYFTPVDASDLDPLLELLATPAADVATAAERGPRSA